VNNKGKIHKNRNLLNQKVPLVHVNPASPEPTTVVGSRKKYIFDPNKSAAGRESGEKYPNLDSTSYKL
jgi:hypothetical protein